MSIFIHTLCPIIFTIARLYDMKRDNAIRGSLMSALLLWYLIGVLLPTSRRYDFRLHDLYARPQKHSDKKRLNPTGETCEDALMRFHPI